MMNWVISDKVSLKYKKAWQIKRCAQVCVFRTDSWIKKNMEFWSILVASKILKNKSPWISLKRSLIENRKNITLVYMYARKQGKQVKIVVRRKPYFCPRIGSYTAFGYQHGGWQRKRICSLLWMFIPVLCSFVTLYCVICM